MRLLSSVRAETMREAKVRGVNNRTCGDWCVLFVLWQQSKLEERFFEPGFLADPAALSNR